MSCFDYIFIDNIEQYTQFYNWIINQKPFTDQFGNFIEPIKILPMKWDFSEKLNMFINQGYYKPDDKDLINILKNNSIKLGYTNTAHDIYLIRNCPFDFIHDELKVMYRYEDEYDKILNHTSKYDNFKLNRCSNPHYKLPNYYHFKDKDFKWDIRAIYNDEYLLFDGDNWYSYKECHVPVKYDKGIYDLYGILTKRKLKRLIHKWKFPKGTIIKFEGIYKHRILINFKIIIK